MCKINFKYLYFIENNKLTFQINKHPYAYMLYQNGHHPK